MGYGGLKWAHAMRPYFPVKTQIPLDIILIISFFTLLSIATLFQASYKSFNESIKIKSELDKLELPKVLFAKKHLGTTGLEILCLLENSELFANDTSISFYYTDYEGFEVLIGVGVIITVQGNNKIQALLNYPIDVYQEILDKLANNDASIRERVVVKPAITRDLIQRIFYTP
jgi:hypothetical protein